MARMTAEFLLLIAALCIACANAANFDVVRKVQTAGAALPVKFQRDWITVLAKQRQRVLALEQSLIAKEQSAENKAVLVAAFQQLNLRLTKVNGMADTLKKQQGQEITQLVKKYVDLLSQRIQAKPADATDESQILQLRKNKMTLLTLWENRVIEVNSEYRAAYRDAFHIASQAAAAKKASVLKALRTAFIALFGDAVTGEEANITLLTAEHFPMVEEFALLAGRDLLELVVAAQAAQL